MGRARVKARRVLWTPWLHLHGSLVAKPFLSRAKVNGPAPDRCWIKPSWGLQQRNNNTPQSFHRSFCGVLPSGVAHKEKESANVSWMQSFDSLPNISLWNTGKELRLGWDDFTKKIIFW